MFTFLLVVHAIIAAALVAVILMQRSEGGGLGMGGSPTGLMSARGAADFLTRATTILATLFVVMSIGLAVLASVQHGPREIDTSLSRPGGAAGGLTPGAPALGGTGIPLADDPLAGAAAAAPVGNAASPIVPQLAIPPAANAQRESTPARDSATSARADRPAADTTRSVVPAAPARPAPRPAAAAPAATETPAAAANEGAAPAGQ